MDGSIFVNPDDGDLVRIEGRLSKTPSFWTRRVEVVRHYQRINGVRVPVAIESVAQVLIAGRSTFSMSYEYETVNDLSRRRSEAAPVADRGRSGQCATSQTARALPSSAARSRRAEIPPRRASSRPAPAGNSLPCERRHRAHRKRRRSQSDEEPAEVSHRQRLRRGARGRKQMIVSRSSPDPRCTAARRAPAG